MAEDTRKQKKRQLAAVKLQEACTCKRPLRPIRDDVTTGTCQRCWGWTPMFGDSK